ncbi:uncharacterized protein LOC103941443 isoform X2 [Pyrus x bretschneideri]|uniref:uncharacterized protein LOC103941443 isoform X2 n=1 Tax=Pyrus x bretschneideri TaxID=225117 RepID=UPI0020302A84|nr:uncharacterized protein LOC103941443 isoform X2 [Pyrus x bretschneideri]
MVMFKLPTRSSDLGVSSPTTSCSCYKILEDLEASTQLLEVSSSSLKLSQRQNTQFQGVENRSESFELISVHFRPLFGLPKGENYPDEVCGQARQGSYDLITYQTWLAEFFVAYEESLAVLTFP